MSRSRPEYKSFVERLNFTLDEEDTMVLMARIEIKRENDSFNVFPCPEPDEEDKYELHFLARGRRYLPEGAIALIEQFQVGDKLWLAHEFQNQYDTRALTLNTPDHHIVGYCPRYLSRLVFDVLMRSPQLVDVRVEKINYSPTPLRFRLLCKMTYSTLDGVQSFSQEEYQPIKSQKTARC